MTHRAPQAGPSSAPVASRRRSAVVAACGALLTLGFVSLGVWQVERLYWKLDLIERVDARVHAAPAAAPGIDGQAPFDETRDEYRHVRLRGAFRHGQETLVQAVTEEGPGFWVVTPLSLASGGTVLVNRGFVPGNRRAAESRAPGQIEGTVEITGLVRLSEPDGGFLRSNDPAADRWFSRDVAAIAAARGLADAQPYFIDADATLNPGGLPVGGLTVVTFRNSHLVYALTWFGLAAIVAGATAYVLRDDARRRRSAAGSPAGATPLPSSNGSHP
ncbi:SURF1 family protein [Aureimonas sp. OT7]|uniref:SURF1 family protein n=1 Tax=Aureimonas sp. OT7 TaxID=2816454 RepID=UPI001FEEC762|nr:SURF1 family protein [Aureimonas sp. OT7]